MRPLQLLIPTATFALGGLIGALAWNDSTPFADAAGSTSQARIDQSLRHIEYEQRIATLTRELESLRNAPRQLATSDEAAADREARHKKNLEAYRRYVADPKRETAARVEEGENKLLLAAGYSVERINWFRKRTEELKAGQTQLVKEKRVVDSNTALAYLIDPDLDLANEIGVEEYDRYRLALGRRPGVAVLSLQEGSSSQSSGIKPGDVIIAYGGKRTYNQGMLNAAVAATGSGVTGVADILRDGQLIRIALPSGPLGIRAEDPTAARLRAIFP